MSSYKILPFQFKHLFDDIVLIVNECSDFTFLKNEIFDKFIQHKLSYQDEDFLKLKSHLFIAQDEIESSLQKIAARYRTKKSFLRDFTTLHMMVITLRCNQRCEYCQVSCAEEDAQNYDMEIHVARRIVDTIFSSPTNNPKIEFQGGEPLLNWPIIKFVVSYAEKIAEEKGKKVEFVICTNLTLITEEQLYFCRDHNIAISDRKSVV